MQERCILTWVWFAFCGSVTRLRGWTMLSISSDVPSLQPMTSPWLCVHVHVCVCRCMSLCVYLKKSCLIRLVLLFSQVGTTAGHCRYLSEALTAPESVGGQAVWVGVCVWEGRTQVWRALLQSKITVPQEPSCITIEVWGRTEAQRASCENRETKAEGWEEGNTHRENERAAECEKRNDCAEETT